MKNIDYHLGQIFSAVSHVDIQCIMHGFLMEPHTFTPRNAGVTFKSGIPFCVV